MTTFGDEASDGMPARSHGTRLFHYDATCARPAEGTGPALRTRPVGGLPHGDGYARLTGRELVVQSRGTDGTTGEPAFTWASDPGGPDDHLKWAALVAHTATSGLPGFDAPDAGELVGSVEMSAQVFGAARHPFGDAVRDPGTDPRLAVGAFLVLDRETRAVFDFFLADRQVFAVYERLPGDGGGDAFAYAVPVGERSPEQVHRLEVALDRARRRARWILDGRTVLTVDPVGAPLPPAHTPHLALGRARSAPVDAAPRQLTFGLGMLTWLGAAGPDGRALVRTSAPTGPATEGAVPHGYVDGHGRRENRLWGQGVRLRVRRLSVTAYPRPRPDGG
ncbi:MULTISPECIES: DUF6081 family protein [unclassified Streptomyces]|uniref:DUF6081 family protein n=1 Tax=unclassified Streptomyces TaxID=2593676 RepID=UPI002E2BF20C|nr:DUF6081 family protein [Streptomyces sp. NBC_00223]